MSFPIYQIGVARSGNVLQISQPDIVVPGDAAVQWLVTGVQNGETVELLAKNQGPGKLGPFTFTRNGQSTVSARGSSGAAGTFEYQLVLYRLGADRSGSSRVAESAPASLTVEQPAPRSGQTILVEAAPQKELLVVRQLHTRLMPGDPVIFEFLLPQDLFSDPWVPSIFFKGQEGTRNRGYGPFAALSVVEGAQGGSDPEGRVRRFLVATGSSGLVGSFSYAAVAYAADGSQLLSTFDPVLDNDGEVVCPGC